MRRVWTTTLCLLLTPAIFLWPGALPARAGSLPPSSLAGFAGTHRPALFEMSLAVACRRTPTATPNAPGLEVRGAAQHATLWALLFSNLPLHVGEETKIVWRMTGSGPFHVSASLPDGTRTLPVWGPTAHSGSNWDRPGNEWGVGFVFPSDGCWDLHASRRNAEGDVWLQVVPGQP